MISRSAQAKSDFPLKTADYNPMPEPKTVGFATTPDGVRLRYAVWAPTSIGRKGTILFLQGRTEFIEKGYETIADFQAKGFHVLSFDWRGQGGSDRMLENPKKGYVDEFDEYVLDLETIVSDVALPDCPAPFYVVAHSTGSLVALLAAPKFPNKIRRMVLASPFFGIGLQRVGQPTIKLFTGAMSAFGLGDMSVGGETSPKGRNRAAKSIYTSDEKRLERNQRFAKEFPELIIGSPTANWIFAACKAMDQVCDVDFMTNIKMPCLFLIAGNDQVVDNAKTEDIAQTLRAGSFLTIDGAQHELFQEADYYREQCLAAIFSFIPGSDKG